MEFQLKKRRMTLGLLIASCRRAAASQGGATITANAHTDIPRRAYAFKQPSQVSGQLMHAALYRNV